MRGELSAVRPQHSQRARLPRRRALAIKQREAGAVVATVDEHKISFPRPATAVVTVVVAEAAGAAAFEHAHQRAAAPQKATTQPRVAHPRVAALAHPSLRHVRQHCRHAVGGGHNGLSQLKQRVCRVLRAANVHCGHDGGRADGQPVGGVEGARAGLAQAPPPLAGGRGE